MPPRRAIPSTAAKPRGIIITNGTNTQGMIYPMVLVLGPQYQTVRQFHLLPVKQMVKMKQRPGRREGTIDRIYDEDCLLYGDHIEWHPLDSRGQPVEIILEYQKLPKHYPVRLYNSESQILLQGIMSKNRNVLWMVGMWPDLNIPGPLQFNAHPNVTVNAWVTLHVTEQHTLKYELHSFAATADEYQFLVKQAAWNAGDDGILPLLYDPVVEKGPTPGYEPVLADTVTAMHGVVISKKIVMSDTHKHECFHRVVISADGQFPEIGSSVRFNAEKVEFTNMYAIKDIVNMNSRSQIPLTGRGNIKVTIRYDPEYLGFYYCRTLSNEELRQHCYLDDPENILEAWLISSLTSSTLQIGMTAFEPSVKGTPRYAVVEIVDAKKLEKIEQFKRSGGIVLKDEPGLIIDYQGRVHVERLPKSNFRVPAAQIAKFPPGTRVIFSAQQERNRWKITSVTGKGSVDAYVVKDEKTRLDTTWFHVPLARGVEKLPFLISCPIFGLVQTTNTFRVRTRPHHYTYSDVWVALNDCHPGETSKPSTKFKCAFVGGEDVVKQEKAVRQCEKFVFDIPDYPSSVSDYPTESNLDESFDATSAALNNFLVPETYPAIPEEEFKETFKTYRQKVNEMLEELSRNPDWDRNPSSLIERHIKKHMSECRACSAHKFSEDCYFAEYMAEVLNLKPEIMELMKPELLNIVATRRFRC